MDWDDDFDPGSDDDAPAVTVACPDCGAEVYEESERCPSCGEWILRTHSPWSGHSTWWVVLGVAGVVATIAVLSGAFG
jgi:predicted RNA-binding Zn-ribbon protein involved in translation (DUF1610 family)